MNSARGNQAPTNVNKQIKPIFDFKEGVLLLSDVGVSLANIDKVIEKLEEHFKTGKVTTLDLTNIRWDVDVNFHSINGSLDQKELETKMLQKQADDVIKIQEELIGAIAAHLKRPNCNLRHLKLDDWHVLSVTEDENKDLWITKHKARILRVLANAIIINSNNHQGSKSNSALNSLSLKRCELNTHHTKSFLNTFNSKEMKKDEKGKEKASAKLTSKLQLTHLDLSDNPFSKDIPGTKKIDLLAQGIGITNLIYSSPVKTQTVPAANASNTKHVKITSEQNPAVDVTVPRNVPSSRNEDASPSATTTYAADADKSNSPAVDLNAPTFWKHKGKIIESTLLGAGLGSIFGIAGAFLTASLTSGVTLTILGATLSATGVGALVGVPLLIIGIAIGVGIGIRSAKKAHQAELAVYRASKQLDSKDAVKGNTTLQSHSRLHAGDKVKTLRSLSDSGNGADWSNDQSAQEADPAAGLLANPSWVNTPSPPIDENDSSDEDETTYTY